MSKMATNPRKFSEKIAILQRKERDDANQFAQVMGEVQQITQVSSKRIAVQSNGAFRESQ